MTAHTDGLSESLSATVEAYHRYMEELLTLHQEALFERDREIALAFWQIHARMLRCHIEVEEEQLIPALKRCVREPAWSGEIYLSEHRKVLAMDDKLYRDLCNIDTDRRSIIGLLDRERSYKNVLEHHHEREEKGLLAELEKSLSAGDACEMALVCRATWGDLRDAQCHHLDELRSRLPAN